jgi:hypothetical protein
MMGFTHVCKLQLKGFHPCMRLIWKLKLNGFVWWLAHIIGWVAKMKLTQDPNMVRMVRFILLGLDGHFLTAWIAQVSFYHPIARHSWPHPKNRPVPTYCIGYYGFYMVSEVMPWQTNPNSTHCQSAGKTRNALLREWSSLITANVRPHWHPMIHPHAGSTMAFLSTNVRHYQVSRSVDPRNPSSLWCTLVLS